MLYNVGLVSATQHRESVMTIKYNFNENFGNATRSMWASTGYKGNKLEKALGWNSGDRIDLGSTTQSWVSLPSTFIFPGLSFLVQVQHRKEKC